MARPIDSRGARFEQGVIAVVLLAAFVFRVELLVPVSAGVLLFGVLLHSSLARCGPGYPARGRSLAGELPPLALRSLRSPRGSLLEAAVLALAFLFFRADLEGLGWLLTLPVAGAAAIDCTTGVSAGTAVRRWLSRRRA